MIFLKRYDSGEILCALGASLFAATGCWIGTTIAVNGVIAHALLATGSAWGPLAIRVDTLCNAALITYGLSTTHWLGSYVFAIVLAAGFACSYAARVAGMDCTAACLHVALVQTSGFVTVFVWCGTCGLRGLC